MKTYRALQRGFVDGIIVEAGQLFTTAAPLGKWMEEVDSTKAEPVEEAGDAETKKTVKRG